MGRAGRTAIRIGILAGVLWLEATGAYAAPETDGRAEAEAAEAVQEQAGPAGEAVQEQAGPAGKAVQEQAGPAGEAVQEQAGPAGKAVQEQAGPAGEAIQPGTAEASGAASFGVPAPVREDLEGEGELVYERTFEGDYHLKGLFDGCAGYFNAGNWRISRAVFVMEYTVSNLLDHTASYVTVSVNGEPVATQYLPEGAGAEQRMVLELPPDVIRGEELNSVTIEAYLRGRNADACVDESSVGTWMNVFQESKVLIAYQPLTEVTSIAGFCSKFTSIEAMDYRLSAAAVPKGAQEAELTAMAQALTGLSRSMVWNYQNTASRLWKDGEAMPAPYTIFFCSYDRLPGELAERLTQGQQKQASESALVCLLPSEKGAVLLLTGTDAAAMENAGRMLANEEYRRQLTGTERQVKAEEDFRTDKAGVEDYVSLTDYGLQVKGVFRRTANFTVEYPANRKLAASSQLSLDYRYSENIDFEKSLLTVYCNQVPIGSRRLTEEEAGGATALFELPPDIETAGDFQVEVVFDLYPEDEDWCRLAPDDVPWGYVAQTSMLKLVSDGEAPYDFTHYPAPFVRDGSLSHVKLLLPKEAGEEDIRVMGGLLLTLGRYLKDNRGGITVSTGVKGDLSQSNLIAIGAAADNESLQQNREVLPVRYGADGKAAGGGRVPVDPGFAVTAGCAQLIESPYAETPRAILFVSGSTDQGMTKVLAYLGETQKLKQLEGDVFLTDAEQLLCYQKDMETGEETAPPVEESVRPGERAGSVYVVLGAVALLVCLAAVMLLAKYRRKDQNEK